MFVASIWGGDPRGRLWFTARQHIMSYQAWEWRCLNESRYSLFQLLIFELEKCEAPDVSFLKEPKIIGEPVYRW